MRNLLNSPAIVGCILLALILIMLVTCNRCNGIGIYQPQARTHKTDTVYLTVSQETGWIRPKPDTVLQVKWVTVYRGGKVVREYIRDTITVQAAPDLLFDTTAGNVYVYADSVTIDTAGIAGTVIIRDSTAGPIIARNIRTTWKLPTVTHTQPAQERGAVYWGPTAQFSPGLAGVGVSAHWKTRWPLLLSGAVLFDANGRQVYQAGAAFKIRLK